MSCLWSCLYFCGRVFRRLIIIRIYTFGFLEPRARRIQPEHVEARGSRRWQRGELLRGETHEIGERRVAEVEHTPICERGGVGVGWVGGWVGGSGWAVRGGRFGVGGSGWEEVLAGARRALGEGV